MKQIKLTSTYLSIFLFLIGCNNQLDTLTLKDSGEVSVVIIDSNGSPVSDGIIDLKSENGDFRYERNKTDDSGKVNFGAFNSGNYLLNIEVTNAGNFYSITKIIQVVSGVNKTYEIDLSEYISSITVHLLNSRNGEPVDGTGYSLRVTPAAYNGEEDLSSSLAFTGSDLTFESLPTGHYKVEIINKENEPITQDYAYVEQYEPSEFYISVNEIEFRVRAKNTYSITSVINTYNSATIDHTYQTFVLDEDNKFRLIFEDETESNGRYYFYNDRIDLNWYGSSIWSVYQTDITQNGFKLTCYDYYLGQEVTVTFE